MKAKNQYVYSDDASYLDRLAEEFASMGRRVKREDGKLVIFALMRKSRRK